jgi:hypothetical protein
MSSSRGRVAFGLGAAAVGWALLLVASAFFVPTYSGEKCQSGGGCTSTSSTLFAENGWWVVELLLAVTVVAAVAFYALHVVCSKESETAATIAVSCTVLLAVFSFLTGFSIGLLVLPIPLLLAASRSVMPRSPRAPRGS